MKQSSLNQQCVTGSIDGGHLILNQIAATDVPPSISVTLSDGSTLTVPLWKYTGGAAHYLFSYAAFGIPAGSTITDAVAVVPDTYTGQFVLSHYTCGETPSSTPVTTPVTTPVSTPVTTPETTSVTTTTETTPVTTTTTETTPVTNISASNGGVSTSASNGGVSTSAGNGGVSTSASNSGVFSRRAAGGGKVGPGGPIPVAVSAGLHTPSSTNTPLVALFLMLAGIVGLVVALRPQRRKSH